MGSKWIGSIAVGLIILNLQGCGTTLDAQAQVTAKAQQRWAALIAGDLEQAYLFYSEAFRQTTTLPQFKNKIQGVGLWKSAQVVASTCDTERGQCQVDVEVVVAMKMRGIPTPVESSAVVHETWIKSGFFADWFYLKL